MRNVRFAFFCAHFFISLCVVIYCRILCSAFCSQLLTKIRLAIRIAFAFRRIWCWCVSCWFIYVFFLARRGKSVNIFTVFSFAVHFGGLGLQRGTRRRRPFGFYYYFYLSFTCCASNPRMPCLNTSNLFSVCSPAFPFVCLSRDRKLSLVV